jgi:hypothetical protein
VARYFYTPEAGQMTSKDNVIFSIVFKKGLAEKNRLPLEHVIATLQQIQQMIRDCGRQIQHDAGIENPDGDFGIELLAGPSGLMFQKGSLKTAAAITHDIPHGILAINTLIDTTDLLEKRQKNIVTPEYAEPILRRLPRVSEIQREDRTELHLALTQNRQVINSSKLGERGRETLKRFEAPEVGIESITIYGKLRELRDKSRTTDDENRGHFWGELHEDSGRIWRIRFKDRDESKVLNLFRKQVEITGNATYFRTQAPRVDAADIDEDIMPDYVAAYERFNAAYRDVFGDRDTKDILDEARG